MIPPAWRALLALGRDAVGEALARRLSVVVAAVAVLGLLTAESCTSFGSGSFVMNGREIPAEQVAGWLAPFLYGYEVMLVWALAGLLAADHLARPVAEGSASLWLARPVARETYALARLLGALGVAAALAAVLLGTTAALLVQRHGLAATPALTGGAVALLGAVLVAALTMAASLLLARVAVVAFVAIALPLLVSADLLTWAGVPLGDTLDRLVRLGPPLGAALAASVAPWSPFVTQAPPATPLLAELCLWAAGGVGVLALAFRRVELGR